MVLALALVASAAGVGCPSLSQLPQFPQWFGRPRPALDAWVTGEMTVLTDRTQKFHDSVVLDHRERLQLFGACNETVSFQVVVEGPAGGARGIRIGCSELVGPGNARLSGDQVKAFRMLPVHVTDFSPWYIRLADSAPQAADYYDALVPITAPKAGQPFAVDSGKRLALWFDVIVPLGTAGGDYSGNLEITSDTHQTWSTPITIQVYDFVLPDARPTPIVGAFDYRTIFSTMVKRGGQGFEPARLDRAHPLVRQGLTIMRQLMVLAHEHRLDLGERAMHPTIKRDLGGKLIVDWDDYDNIVSPYLATGEKSAFADRIGSPAWPMPLSGEWPDPSDYGGAGNAEYAAVLEALSAEGLKHFTSLGFAEHTFLWPYRGPVSQDGFEVFTRLAEIARRGDAKTPILSPMPASAPTETLWKMPPQYARLADIYAPPAQWLEPDLARRTARPDNLLAGVWLSPGQPPYLPPLAVEATGADVRAIPWFAAKYHCTGIFLSEVLNWTGDPFNTPATAQTRLFYPGDVAGIEGVLPSVRLKRLRRGIQDASYLWLLQQRGRGDVASEVANGLVRYGGLDAAGDNYLDARLNGWVQDAATWEMARRLLAEEIRSAVHPEESNTRQLLAQRLAWREFDEKTHTIEVEQIRTTVRPVEGSQGLLRATITLDLYNQYNRPSSVLVRLEDLPEGWTAVGGEKRLQMPPASFQTVALTIQGKYSVAIGTGLLQAPVAIYEENNRHRRLTAAVPLLGAARTGRQIKIDGQLDDWPRRVGNSAGDFRLVGRRGQIGAGLADRQTAAFVLCDDSNLYIAFRCQEPDLGALIVRADNQVHYEQLMACGEDLVELILDPGCQAKGPQDLYHIVVKPNGVAITEKGVHTDPPLGKWSDWPAGAQIAAGRAEGAWTVEMAIPLSSFGLATPPRVWGVNFTRFTPRASEASSWSGAPRYFYDPRNLGTMFLPEKPEP